MPHCCAVGCFNQSRNNSDIAYFRLPSEKDKSLRNAWIAAIKRTDLPKMVYVCEEHFTEDSFDKGYDLKMKLLPPSENKNVAKRRLNPGTVPSIFSHRTPAGTSREHYVKREEKKRQKEVIYSLLESSSQSIADGQSENESSLKIDEGPPDDTLNIGEVSFNIFESSHNTSHQPDIQSLVPSSSFSSILPEVENSISPFTVTVETQTDFACFCANSANPASASNKKYTKMAATSTFDLWRRYKKSVATQSIKEKDIKRKIETRVKSIQVNVKNKNNKSWRAKLKKFHHRKINCCDSSTCDSSAQDDSIDPCVRTEVVVSESNCVEELDEVVSVELVNKNVEIGNGSGVGAVVETFVNREVVNREAVNRGIVNREIVNREIVNKEIETGGLSGIVREESPIAENSDVFDDSFVSVEAADDVSKDPDFVPFSGDDSGDSSSSESEIINIEDERTLIVYESKLKELLSHCPKCGAGVDLTLMREMPNTGSQYHVKFSCFKDCSVEWKSQPEVANLKGLGNLFVTASIAFSGIPFAKIERFAYLINLKFISDSLFYQLRRDFVYPVIKKKWKKERKRMIENLKNREGIVLVGDGRCDSPGHSAKYCTYTFIDSESGEVVDTVVVPVTEVKNSNAMEKEGFIRLLDSLQKEGVKIDIVSTDRHVQIRKLMRVDPKYSTIKHQFDPWHVAKGICKKLNKAAVKRSRQSLLEWIPSIVNHFWWSVETCDKNPQILYEKVSSIMYHVVNKHEFSGHKYFKKCAHAPLSDEYVNSREWLVEGSDAHAVLVSMFKDKQFKADCKYLTDAIHTTNVEIFNNVILKYIPKQYHFEYDHMVMGTYLAALDNNFNSRRGHDQITTGENAGKFKYKIAWRKSTKKVIARKCYQKKHYGIFRLMLRSVHRYASRHQGVKRKSRKRIMAPSDRDDRETLIEKSKKMSRF